MNMLKAVEEIRKKLMFRMDADEETEETPKKGGKKFSGLSTKLPYGIAKDMGIDTAGMTPRQVWDKIAGKGVSPEKVIKAKLEKPAEKISTADFTETPKKHEKITADHFASCLTGSENNRKETELLCGHINSAPGAGSEAGRLFGRMKELSEKCPFSAIKNAIRRHVAKDNSALTVSAFGSKITKCSVKIPKIINESTAQAATHELGHYMDTLCGDGTLTGYASTMLSHRLGKAIHEEKITGKDGVKKSTWDMMTDASSRALKARSAVVKKFSKDLEECNKKYLAHGYSSDAEYEKEFNKIKSAGNREADEAQWNEQKGCDALMDMYDAMSGGRLMGNGLAFGHGVKYYSSKGARRKELIANYITLSIFRPDLLKFFEQDFPKTSEALKNHVSWMLKKAGG